MNTDKLNIDSELMKVSKGTGIVFLGNLLRSAFAFIFVMIIVRYISVKEYGLLSLVLAITNVTVCISSFGFGTSVPRYVSHYVGKKDDRRVWDIIKFSIHLTFILSMVASVLLFFFAELLSELLHKPELADVTKILTFVIPLTVLSNLLISISRGFQDVKPQVYFQSIFQSVTRLSLLAFVMILGFSFRGVLYVYPTTMLFTLVLLVIYVKKKVSRFIPKGSYSSSSGTVVKELVFFSLPLLVTNLYSMLIGPLNTLMLGYFREAEAVGLFNIPLYIVGLIPITLNSMTFIYLPVLSGLHSQRKVEEIKKLYSCTTKWIFSLTLPFILCLVLAPSPVLHVLFGGKYGGASTALQIMTSSFLVHLLLGPNAVSLVALGRPKTLLLCALSGLVANVILNLILIPSYGLTGVSISHAVSFGGSNILVSVLLYRLFKIHPFNMNYIKPMLFISVFVAIMFCFRINSFLVNIWHIIVLVVVSILVCLGSIFITKSFSAEDISIIEAIKRKMRLSTSFTD